jgi:hypothetical protein
MRSILTTEKQPADLTQEEVYSLFETYAGYLDEKAQSQVDHLLSEMSYPEEPVGNVRAEVGDRLYFPAARAIAGLQRLAAENAPPKPPPEPRQTRKERVREALAERREARTKWAELREEANRKKVEV